MAIFKTQESTSSTNTLAIRGNTEMSGSSKRGKLVRSNRITPHFRAEDFTGKDAKFLSEYSSGNLSKVNGNDRRRKITGCHPLCLPTFKLTIDEEAQEIIGVSNGPLHRQEESIDTEEDKKRHSIQSDNSEELPSVSHCRLSNNGLSSVGHVSSSDSTASYVLQVPLQRWQSHHQLSIWSIDSAESGICSEKFGVPPQFSVQSVDDDLSFDQDMTRQNSFRSNCSDSVDMESCDFRRKFISHSTDNTENLGYNRNTLYPPNRMNKTRKCESIDSYIGGANTYKESSKTRPKIKIRSRSRSSSIWSIGSISSLGFSFSRKQRSMEDDYYPNLYNIGETINQLTLTQTLAFPALVPGYTDPGKPDPLLETKCNKCAKLTTTLILLFVVVLLIAILYKVNKKDA